MLILKCYLCCIEIFPVLIHTFLGAFIKCIYTEDGILYAAAQKIIKRVEKILVYNKNFNRKFILSYYSDTRVMITFVIIVSNYKIHKIASGSCEVHS